MQGMMPQQRRISPNLAPAVPGELPPLKTARGVYSVGLFCMSVMMVLFIVTETLAHRCTSLPNPEHTRMRVIAKMLPCFASAPRKL